MSSSAITGPILSDARRAPSGTAAAPSFAFNDSTGTGVYLVSAGVLGLSTAGVQRVVVDASGNVGIGTGSPAKKVEVDATSSSTTTTSGILVTNYSSTIDTRAGIVFRNYDNYGAAIWSLRTGSTAGYLSFGTNNATGIAETNIVERMRLDASGNLLVGYTSGSYHRIGRTGGAVGSILLSVEAGGGDHLFLQVNDLNYNAANTGLKLGRNTSTGRSLNAGGTVNASGADYAEYMTKAGEFAIAKGDLCGVNAEGKLTNIFSEAVAFVVKSTNPSYVGGDSWGAGFEADSEELEAARQKVDRIAFCGQVPVNVFGATPGQWIIPVEENGAIKGQAVSNPSFEQYQLAVGKVVAVEEDGRARIIVKIA